MGGGKGSSGTTRDEKAGNLALNYPMIMMAAVGDVFADLASGMAEAVVAGTEAVAQGLADTLSDAPEAKREKIKVAPAGDAGAQASKKARQAFDEIRTEMREEFGKNKRSFKQFIKNPAFDEGIKIVEGYDFGIPRLTENLSDGDLESYVVLLKKGDPQFGEMLQKLSQWQETVPKFKGGAEGPSGR